MLIKALQALLTSCQQLQVPDRQLTTIIVSILHFVTSPLVSPCVPICDADAHRVGWTARSARRHA